jgi:Icc-related predicted phosphoesterase
VHENQGKEKVGKTIVVNPGYGRNGECALIDLKDNEVNVKFLKL